MQVPKFAKYLRTWGEAGTVKSGKVGKLGNRGITMMMVGYANYHEGDVYRMFNLETGRVTETRDIIGLFCMYHKIANSETTKKLPIVSLQIPQAMVTDDDEEEENDSVNEAVPQLKSEEREDDESESEHSESSSSQASNSNQWVKYTTRS